MKEIIVRIEINDDTLTSDLDQIIGEALNNEGIDCVYEIIEESESEESSTTRRQEIMTNDNKLAFKTEDEAWKYAEEKVGKYDAEIGMIGDKRVLLASTGLPIEDRLRNRFEEVIKDFFEEMGVNSDSNEVSDCIAYCGAVLESSALDAIHHFSDTTKVDVICAGLGY